MELSENLHDLFQEQALATPDAVAITDATRTYTYGELDAMTDAMAGRLQQCGVHFDTPVGIFLDTCAEYALPYIASLKAGGAYMPLDLAYPKALLEKIFAEARPAVVVTKTQYLDRLDFTHDATVICLDRDPMVFPEIYDPSKIAGQTPDHLAFVAYSSGTTGEPKGIQDPHRGAVHSYLRRYEISNYAPEDRVACNIFFVWEMLRPMLKGASIHVIPDDTIYDPRLLVQFLKENRITETLMTPSLLETVLNTIPAETLRGDLADLKVLWLNGEVVTQTLRRRALETLPDTTRLLNTYSISECHDVASLDLRTMADTPSEFCPVGFANKDVDACLFDDDLKPVTDKPGELLIGGPCLARGYLKKPELTAERFVTVDGIRYYRTGDMAQFLPDGTIEILGRCDYMVKIRGYSINLGAVESALQELSSVKSAAVVVDGREGEDKRLVAYVVADASADWTINASGACPDLREALATALPGYAIPSVFIALDSIPLNPVTGKANRKALPEPPRQTLDDAELPELSGTPSDAECRDAMLTIWQKFLGLSDDSLGPDDNFFDFGGHSLLAVKLTVAIEKVFGHTFNAKDIYSYPTVNALLAVMAGGRDAVETPQVNLRSEAVLSEEIASQVADMDTGDALSLEDSRAVFMTGATGFLGSFLLRQLIDTTPDNLRIYCLVRSKPGADPLDRIRESLSGYGLWQEELAVRITALAGDLTEPLLGLDKTDWDRIVKEASMIFHCASLVNYVYPYEIIKPHTVNGTREILSLAVADEVKPVFYVSTNGIFPTEKGGEFPEEPAIDDYADLLTTGYAQAKWVAEKMVWEAVDRGLPACVLRPGNIGHHSITGAANPSDFQVMIINACARTGLAPEAIDWHFEMTPVDFLTKAMVNMAQDPDAFNAAYNVVGSDRIPAAEVFDHMRARGLVKDTVPFDDWRNNLSGQQDPALQLMAESMSDLTLFLEDDSAYDCNRFEALTAARGIQCPAVDAQYFDRLFATISV